MLDEQLDLDRGVEGKARHTDGRSGGSSVLAEELHEEGGGTVRDLVFPVEPGGDGHEDADPDHAPDPVERAESLGEGTQRLQRRPARQALSRLDRKVGVHRPGLNGRAVVHDDLTRAPGQRACAHDGSVGAGGAGRFGELEAKGREAFGGRRHVEEQEPDQKTVRLAPGV